MSRAKVDSALWLLSGAAIVASFALRAGRRHEVRPDFDDGVYWQTALAIGAGHRPYAEVFHSQPPLFSALLSTPFLVLQNPTDAVTTARLLMIAATLLLAATTGGIASLLAGPRAGALAALVVAILPPIQRYCYQFGADMPATALAAVSVFCALRASAARAPRGWWVAAGTALGLAVMTKLLAVLVLPAMLVIAFAAAPDAGRARRAAMASVWAAAGFAAACAVVVLVVRPPPAAWSQIVTFHLQAMGEDQKAPAGALGMLAQWMVPFGLTSSVGMFISLRRSDDLHRSGLVAIAVWAAGGTPFALLYRPISEHHLLLFVAPAAVLTAAGAEAATRRVVADRPWLAPAAITLVAALCAAQAVFFSVSPPIGAATMHACLVELPRSTVLVSDDQELLARAGLRTPPWLVDTSRVRLGSGYLQEGRIIAEADRADGVLFAPAERARLHSPTLLAWAEQRFPILYQADGYRLFVGKPIEAHACMLQ